MVESSDIVGCLSLKVYLGSSSSIDYGPELALAWTRCNVGLVCEKKGGITTANACCGEDLVFEVSDGVTSVDVYPKPLIVGHETDVDGYCVSAGISL